MKTGKSIMLFAAMLLWTVVSLGQSIATDKVPQEVQSAFKAKFPAASNVTWAMEKNMNYEAKFMLASASQRAEFSKTGIWVESEKTINKADLPKNVSNTVMSKNPSCKIADAEEIQSADLGKMYEVGCATKNGKQDYRVTSDGKVEATLTDKY
jgi:hypothetical protein